MTRIKKLGLIGFPLAHSFSKKFFSEKFERENLTQSWVYDLYPIENIQDLENILASKPELSGLNVTIPHKQSVLAYLDALDATASEIGAVNCIKIQNGKRTGYNTDALGFEISLKSFLPTAAGFQLKALVLGAGGAAKAVCYVLKKLFIPYRIVSRNRENGYLTYAELDAETLAQHRLIVNTTPLGTFPNTENCPEIPYNFLTEAHFLYDLVYNPEVTLFMKKGIAQGANTLNGLPMLVGQAEAAWAIWQAED
jgi:shikimate dehydrogenase